MIGIFPRFNGDPQNNPGASPREIRPGLMSRDPDFQWNGIRIDGFIADPGYPFLMTDDPEMDLLDRDQCLKDLTSAGLMP